MARRRRPLLRFLLIFLLILLVSAVLFLFLGVGPLARHLLQTRISDDLGVPLRVDKVRFQPIGCHLVMDNFRVEPAEGQTSPCSAKQAVANLDVLASIRNDGWTVESLMLVEPDIRIAIDSSGALDLGGLNPPRTEETPTKEENSGSRPAPTIAVTEMLLQKGRVRFHDERFGDSGFSRNLDPVDLEVRNFSSRGPGTELKLTILADDGEELLIEGTLGLEPLLAQARIRIQNLPPGAYGPLFASFFDGQVGTGTVSLEGEVDLGENGVFRSVTNGKVTVTDLVVDQHGTEAFAIPEFTLEDFDLDAETRQIRAGRLSGPSLRVLVERDASGALNLAGLSPPGEGESSTVKASAAEAPSGEAATAAWSIEVAEVDFSKARIHYRDASFTPAYDLPVEVSLSATKLHHGPGAAATDSTLNVDGTLEGGGRLSIKLNGALSDGTGGGTIEIADLPVPVLAAPWLAALPALEFVNATAGYRGELSMSEVFGPERKLDVKGRVDLGSLDIRHAGKPFFTCAGIDVGIVEYHLPGNAYVADGIVLRSPELFLERDAAGVFNATSLGGEKETEGAKEEPVSEPVTSLFELASLRIHDGRIHYLDQTVSPAFETTVHDFELGILDLKWGRLKEFYFAGVGSLDYHAPLDFSGRYDAAISPTYFNVDLILKNYYAKPLSPFSERYLGRALDGGAFSIKQDFKVEPTKLDGEVKFLFDHLEVGEKVSSPDAIDVPIGLALFILSKQGKVDEEIKIRGNPADPNFELWPIFWRALVNVVVKLAATPIQMVGDVAGGGLGVAGDLAGTVPGMSREEDAAPPELPMLRFVEGGIDLSPATVAALDALVPELEAEPFLDLRLALAGSVGEEGMTDLAGRRVAAVRKYLVERKGFRPHRVLGMRPGALDEGQDLPADANALRFRLERLDEEGKLIPLSLPIPLP